MTTDAMVQAAIELIDQWVRERPPGAHYLRIYDYPWDQGESLEKGVDIFRNDPRLAAFMDHFSDKRDLMAGFRPGSDVDARGFDGSYFEQVRQELLIKPLRDLQVLLTPELEPGLSCRALTALLYGNIHNLLWQLHVRQTANLSTQTLMEWGLGAEYALNQLGGVSCLSQPNWVDTMIRLQFVRAWSLIIANNHPAAGSCILSLAGWYSYAEKQNFEEVTRERYSDYVMTLYAMLDYEAQDTPREFTDSAALMLKSLGSDSYCVFPAWLSSWAGPKTGAAETPRQPFDIPRFVEAQKRLGKRGVLVDIVITDNRLHVRVHYLDDRWHIRNILADTQRPVPEGESPRGIHYITPTSVAMVPVLRPEMEEEFRGLAELREDFNYGLPNDAVELVAKASPESEVVHWQAIFQQIHVCQEDGNWIWKSEWGSFYYSRSDDFWQTLYDVIYAKIVPEFEQRGIEHLVISPDGSISSLPHHLLRDTSNRRLCDRFRVSYLPNLLALTTCLVEEQSDARTLPAILVADPSLSIRFAAWECADVASTLGTSATLLNPQDARVDRIREVCSGAGIFHFSGHALFDWAAPEASYLSIASKGKMGLAEIRSLQLASGALVFLSACGSARTSHSVDRCESHGIVNAFFDAGAATVIGTLWPVEGAAAALVAHWFYRAWYAEGKGRLESLNEATARLREATRTECESILSSRVRLRGDKPFADEYFWGAFALYGAW